MAQNGQISETEAVLDDQWRANLKDPLSGMEIRKNVKGCGAGKSASSCEKWGRSFLSFMKTFLLLLLVNWLRESSLHLLRSLKQKNKRTHQLASSCCWRNSKKMWLFTFLFLWFALSRNLFLFQGLSLAVLSPPAQLEIDKLPHHEGLCEADACQDGYPSRREETAFRMRCVWSTGFTWGYVKQLTRKSSAHSDFGQWFKKNMFCWFHFVPTDQNQSSLPSKLFLYNLCKKLFLFLKD